METQIYKWSNISGCQWICRLGGNMNSLKVREFQQAIINFSDNSELPIEVQRLCFEEILIKIREKANQQLVVEIKQRDAVENAGKEECDG